MLIQSTEPQAAVFNNDGSKVYVVAAVNDTIYQYSLSTFYDLSTATYDSVSFSVTTQATDPQGFRFSNDGSKLYVVDSATDSVFQYSLSTAFDLSTASYDSVSFSFTSQDNNPQGIVFSNDGSRFYIAGNQNDTIYQYTVSTVTN